MGEKKQISFWQLKYSQEGKQYLSRGKMGWRQNYEDYFKLASSINS